MSALKKTALVAKLARKGSKLVNMGVGRKDTYDFARSEVRTSPGGGVSGTAVVALPSDAVCKLGSSIVSVAD